MGRCGGPGTHPASDPPDPTLSRHESGDSEIPLIFALTLCAYRSRFCRMTPMTFGRLVLGIDLMFKRKEENL